MKTLAAVVLALVLVPVAQASTCEHECKTRRTVPGAAAVTWSSPRFDADAVVLVSVYIDGHNVAGRQTSGQASTFTRGKRTVTVISRTSATRIEIRAANFARAAARVTVKFEQPGH